MALRRVVTETEIQFVDSTGQVLASSPRPGVTCASGLAKYEQMLVAREAQRAQQQILNSTVISKLWSTQVIY